MHSHAAFSRIEPRSIPKVFGIIDRNVSKIFRPKPSTDPFFKTPHAKKAFFHSGPRPQFVVDHVVFPTFFMSSAAFASAWRGIHATIFAVGRQGDSHHRAHQLGRLLPVSFCHSSIISRGNSSAGTPARRQASGHIFIKASLRRKCSSSDVSRTHGGGHRSTAIARSSSSAVALSISSRSLAIWGPTPATHNNRARRGLPGANRFRTKKGPLRVAQRSQPSRSS
jgi:hypothetical protein